MSNCYYAVTRGRTVGVFDNWPECQEAVHRFPNAEFRKFHCEQQATDYVYSSQQYITRNDASHQYHLQRSQQPPNNQLFNIVYTDGCSLNNGGQGMRGGAGIYFPDGKQIGKPLGAVTNQQAELLAIELALRNVDHDQNLEVRTDSMYAIQGLQEWIHEWRRKEFRVKVQNLDLFRRVDHLINNRSGQVRLVHVRGHSGDAGNDTADKLAKQAASNS